MDQISTLDYQFEGFRLDTAQQMLFSPDGEPIALSSRVFDTLKYLVERSGELVDKSALMKAVWPRAVVEENNLSQCILTLRRVLGEVAGERRFILTVPGRGFKFVAPVTALPRVQAETSVNAQASLTPSRAATAAFPDADAQSHSPIGAMSPRQRRGLLVGVVVAALALAVAAVVFWRLSLQSGSATSSAEYEALTDMADSVTSPALSPDGHLLAFIRGDGPFLSAGQIWLKLLPDGEPVQLTHSTDLIFAPTFTPDGAHVAYSTMDPRPGSTWDTWLVPITGGEPIKFLPNASGLSFIGPHEILYSEFKTGLHLGIVSSLDDRSRHREVYLPSHERAMAHYSYLSPDRSAVLVVGMDQTGAWQRCRLVPFDGSSAGQSVGPNGACISAAWSPNGQWMYFSAQVAGRTHLWRQLFPDGQPEQITFGPTDEETVTCSPDGRSLLTAVGREQSTIWLHDSHGERILTSENNAYGPWLSADARRIYFLSERESAGTSELWRMDVASGRKESLLSGFAISRYDISPGEERVVFATGHGAGAQIWTAPADHRAPPTLLANGANQPAFDRSGNVFYRSLGPQFNYLFQMHADGRAKHRVLQRPIVEFHAVSPDGKYVSVDLPDPGGLAGSWIVPVAGGSPILIRAGWWPSHWSQDGNLLYVEVGEFENTQRHGRTAVVRVAKDGLSAGTIAGELRDAARIPHEESSLSMAADPSVYVFVKSEVRRNIYRIPLH